MRQLKQTEVAALRSKLLKKQGGRCPLCGADLTGVARGGAVLDHDHSTGIVRAVLCRVCNSGEGKARNVATRYGGGLTQHVSWMKRLVAYWEKHLDPQTEYLYPVKRPVRRKRAKTS